MKFTPLPIAGAYLITTEPKADDRGAFARVFCAREFGEQKLNTQWVQSNVSSNHKTGTLRGLHYQVAPSEEIKLAYCSRGKLFDVFVDLRTESTTYKQWHGHELAADDGQLLYIPAGCAHGYLTLVDGTQFSYSASALYDPKAERAVRWDDPAFKIEWPVTPRIVSEKDRAIADYR